MKDKNILISMGIIIYIVMSGIDRFVYHIPNVMYIPVAILGIALILIGFVQGALLELSVLACFKSATNSLFTSIVVPSF